MSATTEYPDLLLNVECGVAVLTLNRPEALNTVTDAMRTSVREAMLEAARRDDVRVIVLTGAGRGFCAGADMGNLRTIQAKGAESAPSPGQAYESTVDLPDALAGDLSTRIDSRWSYFLQIPKPIIAAINGPIAGVGLVIAIHADLRFAARDARFATSFAQRGLVAEHGTAWLLPRLIGPTHAMDILLSARKFDGAEAQRIGLVNRAYPDADLMTEVMAYARNMASTVSPRSLRIMKAQIWASLQQTFNHSLEIADREMRASFGTEDFREGIAHFIEKRPPRFSGR